MPRTLFTKETAAAWGKIGGKARWLPKPQLLLPPPQAEIKADMFSASLAQACDEVLAKLRKVKKPQEQAQLARCLRDLRETWHLATGKPRPGQTRPDSGPKQPSRRMPSVFNSPPVMPTQAPALPAAPEETKHSFSVGQPAEGEGKPLLPGT